jgi:hypothetical protein
VTLTFQATVPVRLAVPQGQQSRAAISPTGTGTVRVCIQATGAAPIRYARVDPQYDPVYPATPSEPYPPPIPVSGLRLTAMFVSDVGCLPS